MHDITKLQQLTDDVAKWSDSQFGANRSPLPMLHHLKSEIVELIDALYLVHTNGIELCKYEYADCFMLLLDSARTFNINSNTLVQFVNIEIRNTLNDTLSTTNLQQLSTNITKWCNAKFDAKGSMFMLHEFKRELIILIDLLNVAQKGCADSHIIDCMYKYAYCTSLLIGSALAFDMTIDTFIDFSYAKLEINKNRSWGKPDSNGVVEHIRK
jgi:hypothetical protein